MHGGGGWWCGTGRASVPYGIAALPPPLLPQSPLLLLPPRRLKPQSLLLLPLLLHACAASLRQLLDFLRCTTRAPSHPSRTQPTPPPAQNAPWLALVLGLLHVVPRVRERGDSRRLLQRQLCARFDLSRTWRATVRRKAAPVSASRACLAKRCGNSITNLWWNICPCHPINASSSPAVPFCAEWAEQRPPITASKRADKITFIFADCWVDVVISVLYAYMRHVLSAFVHDLFFFVCRFV